MATSMEVGPVGGADDGDGGGIGQREADERGQNQREEYTQLCGAAENKQLRVGQQGPEIDHGADADKQQNGHGLACLDTYLKQGGENSVVGDYGRAGDIDEYRAEAHGQQQSGLHILFDGEENQRAADEPHDDLLPLHLGNGFDEKVHNVPPK